MSTFAELARRVSKLAVDNSPVILTTVGVIGTITTAYLAGKASFEASDIIRLKEADDEARGMLPATHNEIMKERIRLVWKLYIPAFSVGAATVICIVGANRVGARRAAGLAAGYTILEKSIENYKAKVVETIGERKEQQVRDAVIQDRVNETYDPNMEIYGGLKGELCIDKFSLYWFRSTAEKIQDDVNHFNRALLVDEQLPLSELYEIMDLPRPAYSEQIGWDINDGLLSVTIDGAVTPDKKPCLTMEFSREPLPNFRRFR